jgi:hypothetical protein
MRMTNFISTAALAAAALAPASAARAAIVVDLTNPAGDSTVVQVGQTITARISASTDNPNGLAGLNVRVTTSDTAGGAFDTAPFFATVIPTNPSNTTSSQPVVTSFNSALSSVSTYTVVPGTATFDANGVPTTSTGNRPLSGFTGNNQNGRGPVAFFSADNSSLTHLADVSFVARELGTVFFSLTPNPPSGSEYSATTGTAFSTVTPTLVSGAGFQVQVVPEPAALALSGVAAAATLMKRRRRTA